MAALRATFDGRGYAPCRSRREKATRDDPAPTGGGGGRAAGGCGARSRSRACAERGQRRRRPPAPTTSPSRTARSRIEDLADLDSGDVAAARRTAATSRSSCSPHPSTTSRAPGPTPSEVRSALGGQGRVMVLDPAGCRHRLQRPRRGVEASTAPSWRRSTPPTARTPSPPGCWPRPTSSVSSGSADGLRLERRPGPRTAPPALEREHPAARPPGRLRRAGRLRLLPAGGRRAQRRRRPPLSSVSQAEGEQKVRGEVEARLEPGHRAGRSDRAARRAGRRPHRVPGRRVRVRRPAGRPRGGGHPRGAGGGVPRLVHARWKLECSKALLDGQPAPTRAHSRPALPTPPPPPPPRSPSTPAPEPHYQQHTQHSPWLTDAAITAITVLASRGPGQRRGRATGDSRATTTGSATATASGYTGGGSSRSAGRGSSTRRSVPAPHLDGRPARSRHGASVADGRTVSRHERTTGKDNQRVQEVVELHQGLVHEEEQRGHGPRDRDRAGHPGRPQEGPAAPQPGRPGHRPPHPGRRAARGHRGRRGRGQGAGQAGAAQGRRRRPRPATRPTPRSGTRPPPPWP